jgi:hypothetical protein
VVLILREKFGEAIMNTGRKRKRSIEARAPELKSDLEAGLDEVGKDPSQVGSRSAGQSAGSQGLSAEAETNEDSVEALADTDQALESAAVEGTEDAAGHPERPAHTHQEYGRPDDVPPRKRDVEAPLLQRPRHNVIASATLRPR